MKRFLLFLAIACLAGGCAEKPTATFKRSVMLVRPIPLGTEYVKYFSGVIQEKHDISLGFKTAGQISRILVKEGDFVKQGQPIAQLDDIDYRLNVEALEIQYKQMEDEVMRTRALYESKSVSVNDYEKALAGLEQMKVQLQINRNKLEYTKLCAPTDGYVQSVNFSPAEMVDAGTPVINLIDVHRMEVETELPADVYLLRSHFGRIMCKPSFSNADEIPMDLVSITPKADGNQLYRMRLAFKGPFDSRLSAGTNISVILHIEGNADMAQGFSLPLHAVVQQQQETYVWVFNQDSTVNKRKVKCKGIDGQGSAIITDGLNGDEQVVKAGVNLLLENEKVQVIDNHSETNVGGLI